MDDKIKILTDAVNAGGKAVRSVIPSSGIVSKEGRLNFLTAGDLASEKAVMEVIKKKYPDDVIFSEETETHLSETELLQLDRLWVLDPIDGTVNFRNQRHYSSISLGYVEKGEVKAGMVYDFYHDDLYHAEQGKGAFLNGKLISVGKQSDITQGTLATDNSYNPDETVKNLQIVLKIKPVPFIFICGCASLMMCEIASGKTDLYIHTVLKPWDNAAGFLIVKEAGGSIKGLQGEEITFFSPTVVMGNKKLVSDFLKHSP